MTLCFDTWSIKTSKQSVIRELKLAPQLQDDRECIVRLRAIDRRENRRYLASHARKIGVPPMQYLLEWRVALAKDMLRDERPLLAEVAERVGYQSASAFSTAFTRLTGHSPGEFARYRA